MTDCITISIFFIREMLYSTLSLIGVVVEFICKNWVSIYKTLFIIGEGVVCVFIAIFLRWEVSFISIIIRSCSLKDIWHSLTFVKKSTHGYCIFKITMQNYCTNFSARLLICHFLFVTTNI